MIITGISKLLKKPYYANRRIDVGGKGEIFVTPYFISHSAFDAYMFKIECDGKRILHTGDFRKHGYLGKGLLSVLDIVGRVDILITEGTMLGRKQEQVLSEHEIRQNVTQILRKHKYVLRYVLLRILTSLLHSMPHAKIQVVFFCGRISKWSS